MNLKSLLLPTLFATSSAFAVTPYVEGQLSYMRIDDVESKNIYYDQNAVFVDGKIETEYDNSIGYGVELGLTDIGVKGLRVGLSYTRAKFDLDSLKGSGEVGFNGDVYTGSVSYSASEVKPYGFGDNTAKLYMANLYYDFDLTDQFKPFVGIGAGVADMDNIKDNEFAASASVGAKYYFDKKMYLGAKANYTNINGPKDDIGIKYDDIDLYSATVMLGYEF